ncbi:MAG: acetyl-CoA carboxylase biotin carboxylase subunit [Alphaproteobacteria bacterium]|nr:acetyl-CoA carboxylase biotin carboxylase subunit [Alphaproteobacteria bacterium]
MKKYPSFRKILIANRGEIAVRIARSARALGYRTVAVFSEADRKAPHVAACDQAAAIGPAPAAQSYLSIERLIDAARATGAQAIHPGYGFLAENADFARACSAAELVFIGPDAKAIDLMGDKRRAKEKMEAAGVPVVPGYSGAQDAQTLKREAGKIGYPLMIKAAAGGGGRGMRVVESANAFADALKSASSEAKNAFGDGSVLLEKLLQGARHIEIQIFADVHGNIIHLGERDCSVQRRHQKVIEEAPSPFVDVALRKAMGGAAVTAAKAADYQGAGTVEFLVDADRNFYFLEMNTRLQVEHPVTEMVTRLDLVALQFLVATGEKLPLAQDDVRLTGHAIEARLYAEDPANNFLPAAGMIEAWEPAAGEHVRCDAGIMAGQEVSPFYDPLLAKVIAWGEGRSLARRRLIGALEETVLLGPANNRRFLIEALSNPVFASGGATTSFIDEEFAAPAAPSPSARAIALAAVLLAGFDARAMWGRDAVPLVPMRLIVNGEQIALSITTSRNEPFKVELAEETVEIAVTALEGTNLRFESAGVLHSGRAVLAGGKVHLDLDGCALIATEASAYSSGASVQDADGSIRAPMTGKVIAAPLDVGAGVAAGDLLFVVEAMKMEHEIRAPFAGTVSARLANVGDQVPIEAPLMRIEAAEDLK